jgi:predicted dehydrogenase
MAEPVRIGIVGCGSVMSGPYMSLIELMQCRGQAVVVAACDVEESRRDFVHQKFGISNFATNYQDVVNSDDVDLVMVLTAMQAHAEISLAALEAGKHVLVEKPMGVTLEQAAELVEVAKRSPGHLLPAPHVILSPTYQRIWRRMQAGAIGSVHSARAFYGWSGPYWGQWYYRTGGGPLFDLGVYNVTSLTGLFGPAKRVMAMTGTAISERMVDDEMIQVDVPDNFQVVIDFGEARFAVVTTGFTIQKYRVPGIELYGTGGTIQMIGEDWNPHGFEMWQNHVGAWKVYDETDPNWPWTDGLRHLVECIRENRQPLITPEHGYHVTEIMIKALESGRTGQVQDIESSFPPLQISMEEESEDLHLIHDRSY